MWVLCALRSPTSLTTWSRRRGRAVDAGARWPSATRRRALTWPRPRALRGTNDTWSEPQAHTGYRGFVRTTIMQVTRSVRAVQVPDTNPMHPQFTTIYLVGRDQALTID